MIRTFLKILLLTGLFFGLFYLSSQYISAQDTPINTIKTTENKDLFSKKGGSLLAKTSVAISSNIGLKHEKKKNISSSIYKEIFSISELIQNTKYRENKLLAQNYILIQEYKNLLKTDFKDYIDSAYNKNDVLNALLGQLEYRYIDANSNIKILLRQKQILINTQLESDSFIATLKSKMSRNYNSFNIDGSYDDIGKYLASKEQYYHAKVFITYIDIMIRDYQTLNKYNKVLLDTMINNKQAIINNSYVVLPDSGTELLDDFDLLYREADFKNKK